MRGQVRSQKGGPPGSEMYNDWGNNPSQAGNPGESGWCRGEKGFHPGAKYRIIGATTAVRHEILGVRGEDFNVISELC